MLFKKADEEALRRRKIVDHEVSIRNAPSVAVGAIGLVDIYLQLVAFAHAFKNALQSSRRKLHSEFCEILLNLRSGNPVPRNLLENRDDDERIGNVVLIGNARHEKCSGVVGFKVF